MRTSAAERASQEIARLAGRGHDVATFLDHAQEAVESVVPTMGLPYWFTLDPATVLITSIYGHGCEVPTDVMLQAEYLAGDEHANRCAAVAANPAGVQTLDEATGGDPNRSRVYREFMRPMGIEQEAVVALRTTTGENWGVLSLVRERGQPEFDRQELRFLRAVAPHLAQGVRRGLLVGEATDPEWPDSPGLVVVDPGLREESRSPGVEQWLADLPGEWSDQGPLPPAVLSVAAQALRTAEGDGPPGEVAVARVLSRSGRWIVIHGAPLAGTGNPRAAVILEPAGPARIVPLLMAVYGLTERERDVTRLVLQGDSTTRIARSLYISPHTVQQHLKSIFEKTGVRSRRELVGKVFFSHYEPRVRDNESRAAASKPLRGGPFPHEHSPGGG
ncbi:MAG TPA: LuxR C-terminal-related transcriptional regulator [Actinomycetota bacterium]|nr:LuxR C-terminal-related transcriptional regulator [Actinomycetota bacterium]